MTMKGLLLKDLLNLRQQAKLYVIFIALWAVLTLTTDGGGTFAVMSVVVVMLIPISTIAYDEKANWDRIALSMPVSRRDIVGSKYLLTLICMAVGAALSVAFSALGSVPLADALTTALATACLALVYLGLLLPVVFSVGVEKSRLFMYGMFMVPAVLVMLVPNASAFIDSAMKSPLIVLGVPASILIFAASVLVSIAIYEKKQL